MKYLIAGLGNIGPEYAQTRHNIGFMVVDAIAKAHGATFDSGRLAFTADFKHKGRHFFLIKPSTYMNLSGKAVSYWLKELKVPQENLLVILDDLALPFAKIRLRGKGSSAGHNGLKDIEAMLGSQDYARLRFGIGNDYPKGRQAEFVLSPFTAEERAELPFSIEKAGEIVLSFGLQGLAPTMTQYNGKE